MLVRKTTLKDIPQINTIITDAKAYLKASGSTQWNEPDGYPNEETFINDISNDCSFVCVKDDIVLGVCAIITKLDQTYENYDIWHTKSYLSIHRIAVSKDSHGKGVSNALIKYAEEYAKGLNIEALRADTHRLNKSMQKLLDKEGFNFVGDILLVNNKYDNKRLAYEKIIK